MDSLLDSMGLLCLAVKNSHGRDVGRTKLQKMIYFADRYLGWDVGDYRLHCYGPYSRNVYSTLKTVREELIKETIPDHGSYNYSVTAQGSQFLADYTEHARDANKIRRAEELFAELSKWSREQLAIAATIDYVQRCIPDLNKDKLIERVQAIKYNSPSDVVSDAYDLWDAWKNSHDFKDNRP